MHHALPVVLLVGALALGACKDDGGSSASTAARDRAAAGKPSIIQPSARAYREVAVQSPGAVRVLVQLEGDAPADSVHRATPEQQAACGTAVREGTVTRDGARLADVVVWLPDVREGKPLPLERRYELTIEQCRLLPRVQVAVAGGTINLRALDDAAHRTRFVRHGDGAQLADIATTEPSSVVPDESVLSKPGQVEATCALHPWARAWLMTFDHPYAAATGRDGAARLDGVPAGRQRVMIWHERFGVREDTVDVQAGREAVLEVRLKAR